MDLIQLSELRKTYSIGGVTIEALAGVSQGSGGLQVGVLRFGSFGRAPGSAAS